MTPAEQTLIERRARKLADVKERFVAALREAAVDCGARCVVAADETFCIEKLKDATKLSRLGMRLHSDLVELTIAEGLQEGKALADKTIADRWRDPWETKLAEIPARLIHRAPSGRDLVSSADILQHFLEVPCSAAAGKRLSPAMTLNGWRRHRNHIVRIGGVNCKGFWRYREGQS